MTTSPPWQQMLAQLPINGVSYWVVQYRWFSRPFLATWIEDTQLWEAVDTLWCYPWYITPFFRVQ